MCKVLKISESGYYRWLKNKDKPSKRKLLLVKIKEILSEQPDNANYGYDRIHKALEICGIKVSRNTVYRAMKEWNLIHKARKPHGITKATTEIQDKENLIKRDFTATEPVKKLLTDITEVQCLDGNVDDEPELAMKFKVSSIPMLVLFKNGKIISTSVGYRPKDEILNELKLYKNQR